MGFKEEFIVYNFILLCKRLFSRFKFMIISRSQNNNFIIKSRLLFQIIHVLKYKHTLNF